MDGAIGPAFDDYLGKIIDKADQENAQLIVIQMDTPGGLLTSTRDMVSRIIESKTPIAIWVTPSGAHAASAGTFLMYAAHIAAMDEGTNIGAATPIQMKGKLSLQANQEPEKEEKEQSEQEKAFKENFKKFFEEISDPNAKAMQQKALEDTTAFIRGLAEMRGRNAEWAEKAVIDADSITASEALEKNVIDLIATSRAELLAKLDGKLVTLKDDSEITLNTKSAQHIEFPPDWRTKLLSMITDPNVAFILMTIGVYGLILEFYHPGTMVPGTVGAVCLILGLFAMNVLPVNAAGIVLLLLGLCFMIAEAFVPSFGILGFGGLAAFIFGSAIMFDTEGMPGMGLDMSIIAGIAVLGAAIMAIIVFVTARAYSKKQSTGPESMIGEKATVVSWSGAKGKIFIKGELWNAVSDNELELGKDDEVTIETIDDLTIKIVAND
jgi:membrane-bound serine protease (ClpP class)